MGAQHESERQPPTLAQAMEQEQRTADATPIVKKDQATGTTPAQAMQQEKQQAQQQAAAKEQAAAAAAQKHRASYGPSAPATTTQPAETAYDQPSGGAPREGTSQLTPQEDMQRQQEESDRLRKEAEEEQQRKAAAAADEQRRFADEQRRGEEERRQAAAQQQQEAYEAEQRRREERRKQEEEEAFKKQQEQMGAAESGMASRDQQVAEYTRLLSEQGISGEKYNQLLSEGVSPRDAYNQLLRSNEEGISAEKVEEKKVPPPQDALGGSYTGETVNGRPVYEHPQGGKYTQQEGSNQVNWITDTEAAGVTQGESLEQWHKERQESGVARGMEAEQRAAELRQEPDASQDVLQGMEPEPDRTQDVLAGMEQPADRSQDVLTGMEPEPDRSQDILTGMQPEPDRSQEVLAGMEPEPVVDMSQEVLAGMEPEPEPDMSQDVLAGMQQEPDMSQDVLAGMPFTPEEGQELTREQMVEQLGRDVPGRMLDPFGRPISDVYGQGDAELALGREAQSGIEAQMSQIADQIGLDAEAEVSRQQKVVGDQFQQQREQLARMFALTPGAEGQKQRRFEQLAGEEARALAQVDATVRAQAREEGRANLAALTGLQESREQAALGAQGLGLQATGQAQQFLGQERQMGLEERGIGLEEAELYGRGEKGETLGGELGRGQAGLATRGQEFQEEIGRREMTAQEAELYGAGPGGQQTLSSQQLAQQGKLSREQMAQQGDLAREELALKGKAQTHSQRVENRRVELERQGMSLERDKLRETSQQFDETMNRDAERMGLDQEQMEHIHAMDEKQFDEQQFRFDQEYGQANRRLNIDQEQLTENVRIQDEERTARYAHLANELGLQSEQFERAIFDSDRNWASETSKAAREHGLNDKKFALAREQVENEMSLNNKSYDEATREAARRYNLDYRKYMSADERAKDQLNIQSKAQAAALGIEEERWDAAKRTNEKRESQIDQYFGGLMAGSKGGSTQTLTKEGIQRRMAGAPPTADYEKNLWEAQGRITYIEPDRLTGLTDQGIKNTFKRAIKDGLPGTDGQTFEGDQWDKSRWSTQNVRDLQQGKETTIQIWHKEKGKMEWTIPARMTDEPVTTGQGIDFEKDPEYNDENVRNWLEEEYPNMTDSEVDQLVGGDSLNYAVSPDNWYEAFTREQRSEISAMLMGTSYTAPPAKQGLASQIGMMAGQAAVGLISPTP